MTQDGQDPALPDDGVTDLEETIPVTDVNQAVGLIATWHANRVARIKHFLEVPEGQEVQVGDEPKFELSGDVRKGFMLGIQLALDQVKELPFAYETEDEQPPALNG